MITCIIIASPLLPQVEELEYVQKRVLLKKKNTDRWAEISNCCAVFPLDLSEFIYMEKAKRVKATTSNYTLI